MAGRRQTPSARQAAARWAAYLKAGLARRGWTQADLIRAAGKNSDGSNVLSSSRVSQWWHGKQAASPEYAVVVARALGEPPSEALAAIGEEAVAGVLARAESNPTDLRPASRYARDDDEAFIAKLRSSSDPKMHELADRFEADLERVRRLTRVEFNEIQREHAEDSGEAAGADNTVDKTA